MRLKCVSRRAAGSSTALVALTALVGLGLATATPGCAQSTDGAERASAASRKSERSEKPKGKAHKVAIQVNDEKPETMNLALNNAKNVVEHFKAKGENVTVEVVAFGPGLHMLRDDTSPVKQRIATMALEEPSITFAACSNTQSNMSKREDKPIKLVSEAKVVPSGVVRLMELQQKGYAYIRP